MKKGIMAGLLLAAAFTLVSCGDKDSRDGKKYKSVKIGEQVWMAENLNYDAPGSKCLGNNPENCKKYGKLYNWETAQTVCPEGWHLPSDAEWANLLNFIGEGNKTSRKLKAKNGWIMLGNGTDDYGFSALPGGYCGDSTCTNSSISKGIMGCWWVANAYGFCIHGRDEYEVAKSRSNQLSVRCLKGAPTSVPAAPTPAPAANYSSALQTSFPNGSLGENKRPIEVFFQNVSKSGNSYTVNGYTKTKAAQDTFSGTLTISSETKGGSCGAGTELKGSYNFNEKESKTSGRFAGNFVACENSGRLSSGNFDGKWIKHSNNNAIPCSWKK